MSEYVHILVHKMSMREKGYFKKTSVSTGNQTKNYLQLYEYVEKTPTYKLADVQTKFQGLPIGKYLSSEYNYLAEQLMKSLVNYHFEKSEKNKIRKSTLFINVLIDKNLRKKAHKILKQNKKSAYKNELFSEVLALIDLEEEILFKQGILGFTEKLKSIQLERQNLIDKINNLNQFRLLKEQVRDLWFQKGYLDPESNHPLFEDPIFSNEKLALSLRAKSHWLYIVGMGAYITQNHDDAVILFKQAIDFVDDHNHLFKIEESLVVLSNYLYNCALAKDLLAFNKILKKLEEMESSLYIQYIIYCRTMEMYYQIEDHLKSKELDQEVGAWIKENQEQLPIVQANYTYFLVVRNKIIQREFEIALDYINLWLRIKFADYYYLHVKLFSLIIHVELKNYLLLKSEINSSYKGLRKHKQYNQTAKNMLSFFKKFQRNPDKELILLQNLKQELLSFKKGKFSEINYKYFDYLIWVDSKLNHIKTFGN